MTPEILRPQRPYEKFGITDNEVSLWRISDDRLKEILANPNTVFHNFEINQNNYGEFLFLTASRGVGQDRICMTFWGLGYHEYRERWIHKEWFWHQTPTDFVDPSKKLSQEDSQKLLDGRREEITHHLDSHEQSEQGKLFEALADMTDDDAALAEMQDLGLL
ncbi:hypothetical protein KQH40_00180 [bacterium]|nr:hypothetical protein [bacterium]